MLRRWIKQFAGGLPSQAITAPAKLAPVQEKLPVCTMRRIDELLPIKPAA